jgi:hypothetical protein
MNSLDRYLLDLSSDGGLQRGAGGGVPARQSRDRVHDRYRLSTASQSVSVAANAGERLCRCSCCLPLRRRHLAAFASSGGTMK